MKKRGFYGFLRFRNLEKIAVSKRPKTRKKQWEEVITKDVSVFHDQTRHEKWVKQLREDVWLSSTMF